jgi:hypothetical protein
MLKGTQSKQLFLYRFVECVMFSFPFLVAVTAFPPASFSTLLGKLIPIIGRSIVVVGLYLTVMYGLFVLEIVDVRWKGTRLSTKRFHRILAPSIAISFIISFWSWASANLAYVLFVIWLYLATFVLLSIILVALEPLIARRFRVSAGVIAKRSRGRLILGGTA